MSDNLVAQLRNYVNSMKANTNKNSVIVSVTITDTRTNIKDKAMEIFEKHKLKDLNVRKRKKEFVFNVYIKEALPEYQKAEDLDQGLRELDAMDVKGIVSNYDFGDVISTL